MKLPAGWEQGVAVGYPLARAPNGEAVVLLMGDQSCGPARNHANLYSSYAKFKADYEKWSEERKTTFGAAKQPATLRTGAGTLSGRPAHMWVVYFPVTGRSEGVAAYVGVIDGTDARLREAIDMVKTVAVAR
jgi:hypothetical protein